jgi:hypothetical protein
MQPAKLAMLGPFNAYYLDRHCIMLEAGGVESAAWGSGCYSSCHILK